MNGRRIFVIFVAALLVGALLLFLVSFQVRENESAIVFAFGKAQRIIPKDKPGFYWRLPYPFQTVTRYDTRIRVLEGKFDESFTKDQHTLITTVAFGWAIDKPKTFYESIGTPRNANAQLLGLVGGAAKNIINKYDLAEFISTTEDTFKFDDIEREIHHAVKPKALADYGVDVRYLNVVQLGFPGKVTEKVINRIKAERSRKADAYRAQGKRDADIIRSDAGFERDKTLTDARAKAIAVRGDCDKIAAKHYAVFQQNPELAAFLREVQAIEKLKQRLTLILTTDSPIWRLLDLKYLRQATQKPAAPRGN